MIVGAPGAGKSSQIRITLRESDARRRLVFDIEGEYAGFGAPIGADLALLKTRLIDARGQDFAFVYNPCTLERRELRRHFGVFCRLAFAARDCLVVVDELADVTSASPHEVLEAWDVLMRRGRKRGVQIIAGTQRPAHIDKNLWSFTTRLRVGRLGYDGDLRELTAALNVERAEVAALKEQEWIERDRLEGSLSRGSIAWNGGEPYNQARAAPSLSAGGREGGGEGGPLSDPPQEKPAQPSKRAPIAPGARARPARRRQTEA